MVGFGVFQMISIIVGNYLATGTTLLPMSVVYFNSIAVLFLLGLGMVRVVFSYKKKLVSPKWNYLPFLLLLLSTIYYYYQMRTDRAACIGVLIFAWTLLPLENFQRRVRVFWRYWAVLGGVFLLFAFLGANATPSVFIEYSLEDWQTHVRRSTFGWMYFFFALTASLYFNSKSNAVSNQMLKLEKTHSLVSDRLNKILAHNLRTPMTALKMQMELERLKGQQHSRLNELVENLIQQTNQLLAYNSSRDELTSNELVKRVRADFGPKVEVSVSLTKNFQISASNALYFSLQNFISNALKFSDFPVHFSLKSFNDDLVFIIEDEGLGMNAADLEQLGASMTSSSGLGIGLQLSFELLQSFGYFVTIQSISGIGTKVILSKTAYLVDSLANKNWPTRKISPLELRYA